MGYYIGFYRSLGRLQKSLTDFLASWEVHGRHLSDEELIKLIEERVYLRKTMVKDRFF